MNPLRTTVVALVSTFALSGFAVAAGPAIADQPDKAPCAAQQAQFDKASAKLAALTAKWQENPTQANRKAKKAQAQRVAKAGDRLEECQAEQA